MIRLHRLARLRRTLHNPPQQLNKRQRMLRQIDLPPEQRHPRPVLLRIINQLKRIQRRPRTPPPESPQSTADHTTPIPPAVPARCMESSKHRPPRLRHPRQRPDNMIIQKRRHLLVRQPRIHIRVEQLQKITEPLLLRLNPEILKRHQRLMIILQIVRERNRIQPQIRPRERLRVILRDPPYLM